MLTFDIPPKEELASMGRQERMDIFRQYFASSRYNRLLIQQALVRTALPNGADSDREKIEGLERLHNTDFFEITNKIRDYGFFEEFTDATREEDDALQKIIEAYNKRMAHR